MHSQIGLVALDRQDKQTTEHLGKHLRVCILFLSIRCAPSRDMSLEDTVFNKPLEIQQHVHLGISNYQTAILDFFLDYANVKSMVWCFSLESQRLTAHTKLKQQEHLDCYRARHRTDLNNLIYFLTWLPPEIQTLMR